MNSYNYRIALELVGKMGRFNLFVLFFISIVLGSNGLAQTVPFSTPYFNDGYHTTNTTSATLDLNRDGVPEIIAPGFIGLNPIVSLNEDGQVIKQSIFSWYGSPQYPAGMLPSPLGMTAGRINSDRFDDLIWVSSSGSVHVFYNAGGYLLNQPFGSNTQIDFFGPSYVTINPPFVSFRIGMLKVLDLDSDGLNDILVGVAPINTWSGMTVPGELIYYRNLGNGSFAKHSLALPGNVIDVEWADLDRNGTKDHLVIVTETGSSGVYGYDVHHAAFSGGQLAFTNLPQRVSGRVTSLEIADANGDGLADYFFSSVTLRQPLSSNILWIAGDGLGGINQNTWGNMNLPAQTTGLDDHIVSIRAHDFNKDGFEDLIAIRGYSTLPLSSTSPTYADSDLIQFSGPLLSNASSTVIPLGGFTQIGLIASGNFSMVPQWGAPETLRWIDLGHDKGRDFFIGGIFRPLGAAMAIFKNAMPPLPGEPAIERVGTPSGGNPGKSPRLGFDGGSPVIGNNQFAATISNIQGGTLVGLTWASWAMPNIITIQGISLNVIPEVWGNIAMVPGSSQQDGFYSYPIPIPNILSMAIDSGYFQYMTFDSTTGRFGGTQATHIQIGN